MSNLILVWIIIAFAAIHAVEFASYFARLAGSRLGKPVSGYVLQNAMYVVTRFFYLALMPVLGLCIDVGISRNSYLVAVHLALIAATCGSLVVLAFRRGITRWFERVLAEADGGSLQVALWRAIKAPRTMESPASADDAGGAWRLSKHMDLRLAWLSSIVFMTYSMGVFGAFFFALLFPEYRASISQLSGLVNGAATVLLTFVIEPRLSARIDADSPEVEGTLAALLWGRLLGVSIYSHAIVGALWLVSATVT